MGSLLGPTHSMVNNIYANSKYPAPTVGMGATMLMATDRHAGTIIRIVTPKKIIVQRDTSTRTDNNGMSESQTYDYTPDTNGEQYTVTLRKNGRWVIQGQQAHNGTAFAIGHRSSYFDYCY